MKTTMNEKTPGQNEGQPDDVTLPEADFTTDIPYDLAMAAHSGTSFFPEQRASQEQTEYARILHNDWRELTKLATTDEKRAVLKEGFARYREGYRKRQLALLRSQSGIVSTMITGSARFPVERMKKRGYISDKRRDELLGFRGSALAAIRRDLQPELRSIMAGDWDALERLKEKIAIAEELQETMKAANTAIRKHKNSGEGAQVAALMALGHPEARARQLLNPDFCGRVGFPQYELTNNNANIRRMKTRLEGIARNKNTPDKVQEADVCRIEDCPSENRVRLYFPEKPAAEVRSKLKAKGFRWAPSLGCWQAYRNPTSLGVLSDLTGG
jgi:hypothetical protein